MELRAFDRSFFGSEQVFSGIGRGALGGKAQGLVQIHDAVRTSFPPGQIEGLAVDIPRTVVITTDFFDAFMKLGDLWEIAGSELPDSRIAHAFQRADIPARFVGDLRALAEGTRRPLAIRSSSLLEDAMFRPFAGVYGTKMIPNNQHDAATRFHRLAEAVKFVLASTFFADAKRYVRSLDGEVGAEKMAVVIQEVVGRRMGDRFYPHISGVARSYNFYPAADLKPEDGVVQLALGLGKTIVDGGLSWSYCPAWPRTPPPFKSMRDMLDNTQKSFWAVHMGPPPPHDPIRETEHLTQAGLADAEYDNALRHIASTIDARSGRLVPTVGVAGPRVLDFAPVLRHREIPLNDVLRDLLRLCEEVVGSEVEIEFAVELERRGLPARLAVLQVRPMVVSSEAVDLPDDWLTSAQALVSSRRVLGNGSRDNIADVVYLRPDRFEPRHTGRIAVDLERINAALLAQGRHYALVGFGRWGTTDPWFGVPVLWSQISQARVIVEAPFEGMGCDPSQGSHFFHNVTSFEVLYFTVGRTERVDWDWLEAQPAVTSTELVRHVRLSHPLRVRVDGRTGRGAMMRTPSPE